VKNFESWKYFFNYELLLLNTVMFISVNIKLSQADAKFERYAENNV